MDEKCSHAVAAKEEKYCQHKATEKSVVFFPLVDYCAVWSETMKKAHRMKKNDDFQLVYKNGKSFANRQFVIYILKKPDQKNFRIGLSVSKQIGTAVVRNRVKRLIRETFQHLKEDLPNDYDFVIIA